MQACLHVVAPASTSKTRSKTGCLRCRRRHIRCDETWPSCENCAKLKLSCEDARFRVTTQPRRAPCIQPPPTQGIVAPESRLFHSYIHEVAGILDTSFDSKIWSRLVPCFARSDAGIWHATIAIAQLYRSPMPNRYSISSKTRVPISAPQRQAIAWYDKSLALSRKRQPSVLACFLFACIELHLGNVQNALNLLTTALELAKAEGPMLDGDLAAVLNMLRMFVLVFGRAVPEIHNECLRIKGTGIADARIYLSNICSQAQSFINDVAHDFPDLDTATNKTRQDGILDDLRQWRIEFLHLPDDGKLAQLLVLWYFLVIQVSCALDVTQMKTDHYTPEFEKLLDYTEHAQRSSTFIFENGPAPCVYWAIWKCRAPRTRHRALALLRQYDIQCEPWSTKSLLNVAAKIIQVEGGEHTTPPAELRIMPAFDLDRWMISRDRFDSQSLSVNTSAVVDADGVLRLHFLRARIDDRSGQVHVERDAVIV